MRNAALVLGLIGGLWAMIVGFFVYGYVEFVDWFGEVPDIARQVEDPACSERLRFSHRFWRLRGLRWRGPGRFWAVS